MKLHILALALFLPFISLHTVDEPNANIILVMPDEVGYSGHDMRMTDVFGEVVKHVFLWAGRC
jgi:hypothetical protein